MDVHEYQAKELLAPASGWPSRVARSHSLQTRQFMPPQNLAAGIGP
jgi:hypothetical protein